MGILKGVSTSDLVESIEELVGSLSKDIERDVSGAIACLPSIITGESYSKLNGSEQSQYSNVSTGSNFYKTDHFTDISQILVDFRPESMGQIPTIESESDPDFELSFVGKFTSTYKMEELREQEVKEWFFAFLYQFMTTPIPQKRLKSVSFPSPRLRNANNVFCMFIMDLISLAILKEPKGKLSSQSFYLVQLVRKSNYLSTVLMNRLNLTGKPLKGFLQSHKLLNSIKSHNLSIP